MICPSFSAGYIQGDEKEKREVLKNCRIFRVKRDLKGEIVRYKARKVVKSYHHKYGDNPHLGMGVTWDRSQKALGSMQAHAEGVAVRLVRRTYLYLAIVRFHLLSRAVPHLHASFHQFRPPVICKGSYYIRTPLTPLINTSTPANSSRSAWVSRHLQFDNSSLLMHLSPVSTLFMAQWIIILIPT